MADVTVGQLMKGLAVSSPRLVDTALKEVETLRREHGVSTDVLTMPAGAEAEAPAAPAEHEQPQPEAAPPSVEAEPSPSPAVAPVPTPTPQPDAMQAELQETRVRLEMLENESRRYQAAHGTVGGMYAKERARSTMLENQVATLTVKVRELEESAQAHPATGVAEQEDDGLNAEEREVLGPDVVSAMRKMTVAQRKRLERQFQSRPPQPSSGREPSREDPTLAPYVAQLDALIPDRQKILADPTYAQWLYAPGTYRSSALEAAEGRRDAIAIARMVDEFRASTPPAAAAAVAPSAGKPSLSSQASPASRGTPHAPVLDLPTKREYRESEITAIYDAIGNGRPIRNAEGRNLTQGERKSLLNDVRAAAFERRVVAG